MAISELHHLPNQCQIFVNILTEMGFKSSLQRRTAVALWIIIFVVVVSATDDTVTENRGGIYHLVAHPVSVCLLSRPMSPKCAFGEHMLSAKTHLKSESRIMFCLTLFFKCKPLTFRVKCSLWRQDTVTVNHYFFPKMFNSLKIWLKKLFLKACF